MPIDRFRKLSGNEPAVTSSVFVQFHNGMTRRDAASEEVQNDGVRVVPGRSEQAIVDSPKALRAGKRRSGNQFANKAGSIVVGVIPLVVPNGSIEAKGFPKFDLVALARLLVAQHLSNSLDRSIG